MSTPSSSPFAAVGAGAATGIGSMPGTGVRAAAGLVLDELPDLPHLVELPARGAGADLVGRTLALLPGFAAETVPTGWRLTSRPGPDARRARAWLDEDLDTVEELAQDYAGPFKVSLAGPVTLASAVELASGERVARDPGAVRDLTASLAEAVRLHVADVRARLPHAALLVQLDEPGLPAMLAGRVPTASGFGTVRALDEAVAEAYLRDVLAASAAAGAGPLVHCCAAEVPVDLLVRSGARAVSLDLSLRPATDGADEVLGRCVESGIGIFLGVVATDGTGPSDVGGTVQPVQRLWHRLGFAPDLLESSVVLTPACGLAGASSAVARAVLARVRAAARALSEDPEGER